MLGYLQRADAQELDNARKSLGFERIEDGPEAFICSVMASPCATAVIPMQDILHLDNRARMNLPGTIGGNWAYRMRDTDLTDELSNHLRDLNRTYGR